MCFVFELMLPRKLIEIEDQKVIQSIINFHTYFPNLTFLF